MKRLFLFLGCAITLVPVAHAYTTNVVEVYEAEIPNDIVVATVTAYTSDPAETDDTPLTTASGQTVRKGIVANNCEEFGTLVKIQGVIYEVQDRMNRRYGCERFDIWTEKKSDAYSWGVRTLSVTILK